MTIFDTKKEIMEDFDDEYAYDPIEDEPKLKPVLEAAEKEALAQLADQRQVFGFCHLFWSTKKEILKEKYGLDWKTPAEMNPHTCFD
jgi:hypothetical protein